MILSSEIKKVIFCIITCSFSLSLFPYDVGALYDKTSSLVILYRRFIERTQLEYTARIKAVENELGVTFDSNFYAFPRMSKEEKAIHEDFIKYKLPLKETKAHIKIYLENLSSIRERLVLEEKKAHAHWELKNKNMAFDEKFTSGKVFGTSIRSKRIGVILDNSASMARSLPILRKEITKKFPNAIFIEVRGCLVKPSSKLKDKSCDDINCEHRALLGPDLSENPFDPQWHSGEVPRKGTDRWIGVRKVYSNNMLAFEALLLHKKVDTVYWFSDFLDTKSADERSLLSFLKRRELKLYLHTVVKKSPHQLKRFALKSGGGVITQTFK